MLVLIIVRYGGLALLANEVYQLGLRGPILNRSCECRERDALRCPQATPLLWCRPRLPAADPRFAVGGVVTDHTQRWSPALPQAIPPPSTPKLRRERACQTCGHKPSNHRRDSMHAPQARVCYVPKDTRKHATIRDGRLEFHVTSAMFRL